MPPTTSHNRKHANMSRLNTIIPLIIVTGVGIFNGLYVFEPAFKEQQEQKEKTFEKQHNQESGTPQEPTKKGSVASSTKLEPSEAVLTSAKQPAITSDGASGSGSWFKSWGLAWPGSKANTDAKQTQNDLRRPLEQSQSISKPGDSST
ncbi:hypothetical protein B0J12DRAFT_132930 [Macrophomina phaseolina]|uniref:Uncharacterized protein n=1 Tax=Macrophomina phaseolina TaxID=35725 RepID=A0ABQ8G6R1_9PEZI|nr:hypothetical protein B0J12DRAFT_132930 [Macrophomina phaseolina]